MVSTCFWRIIVMTMRGIVGNFRKYIWDLGLLNRSLG